ncbi:organic cation transporter protein-like isoform X2 [Lineus longissimus]
MESAKPPMFEDLLDTVGHFGLYQIRIYLILTFMDVSNSQCMLFYVFGNVVPDWTCLAYEGFGNVSSLLNATNSSLSNATDPFKGLCKYEGAKCEAFHYDGRLKTIVTEWDLVCDKSYVAPLTSSLLMAGVLVGAFSCGQIADMFGRKKIIITVCAMQMLCQISIGFANPWQVYAALRFLTGFFVGGSLMLCFTIPVEFIGPKWRTFVGALGFFGFGLCLLTLWAWILPDWRHQAFASGSSTLILIPLAIFWVPESVRWLIQKGRFDEAEEIIVEMAKVNKKPVPKLALLREIAQLTSEEEASKHSYNYLDLFRTRDNAIRTVIMMFVWLSSSTLYYGIGAQLVNLFGNMYINTIVGAITSMPISWTVIPVANWMGRKKAYLGYVACPCLGLIVILILAGTGGSEKYPVLITVLALICLSGANASWALATTYSGELFATLIRNIAIGAFSVAARVGGIIAPQFAYLGEIFHWTVPYIIYAILSIGSTIGVLVALPETNGEPLPEEVFSRHSDTKFLPQSAVVPTEMESDESIDSGHHTDSGYAETEHV